MFTFCIVLYSTTNPTNAYIVPGGTATTIGFATINLQNISISGSYIIANVSGAIGLTLNYAGGTGVTISSNSYFQAIRIA